MKINYFIPFLLVALCLVMGSCLSDDMENRGMGTLDLQVTPAASFSALQSRAADLSAYGNTSNYRLKITEKTAGAVVFEGTVGSLTGDKNQFKAGAYDLTVSFGEAAVATQGNFYVEGKTSFQVTSQQVKDGTPASAQVTCSPKCAKVNVNFGSKMAEYFSDYYVTYQTAALTQHQQSAVWSKSTVDPWYLQVQENEVVTAIIHVVRKSDGKWTEVTRTQPLADGKAWTLNIDAEEPTEPEVEEGKIELVITIDERTNDKQETIVVPNEWWM